MKKIIMAISIMGLLLSGCANQKSISPDGKKYVGIDKTHFKSGKVSSEFLKTTKDGRTGTLRKYGFNGKVTSNTTIVNGSKNGYSIMYDSFGNVLKKTPYKNGFRQGTEIIYYPGGQIMVSTPYAGDKKHGKAIAYNPDGSVNKSATFNKGKRVR